MTMMGDHQVLRVPFKCDDFSLIQTRFLAPIPQSLAALQTVGQGWQKDDRRVCAKIVSATARKKYLDLMAIEGTFQM